MRRFGGHVAPDGSLTVFDGEKAATCGGLRILHRGYIANSAALRAGARAQNALLDEDSPAHTFAVAYRRWGVQLSRHVLGEYAVAIYDVAARTLLLVHDELGIIPLYFAERGGGVVFASDLAALVDDAAIGALDEEFIADYLCYGEHYGGRTPYASVRRLPAGTSVSWSGRGLVHHENWTLTAARPIRYRNPRDYQDHLRALVAEAVTSALPAAGRTWCELSGGLDSSTVLAVAARARAPGLGALSFVYPESPTADESHWITSVLEQYPVPWHPLNVDAARPFTEIADGFCGQPHHSMVNAALHHAYNTLLIENDVDIVLTGMGGDAVFLGDGPEPFFLADLLRKGRLGELITTVRRWARDAEERRPASYWLRQCAIWPALRHLRGKAIEFRPGGVSWLAAGFARSARRDGHTRTSWVPSNLPVGESWFLEGVLGCANSVSLWGHSTDMHAEFRHPLMYRPLVDFMYAVPWKIKLHPGLDRPLQRAAFAGILPERVLRRDTKSGPDQAIYAGLGSGHRWRHLLTDHPRMAVRGYVDGAAWARAVDLARVGRCDGIKYFISAATLELWLQQLALLDKRSLR